MIKESVNQADTRFNRAIPLLLKCKIFDKKRNFNDVCRIVLFACENHLGWQESAKITKMFCLVKLSKLMQLY